MNWQTRTSVLFIFFLITLISCEEPGEIGLDGIGNDNKLGTAYTDTLTVKASTVLVNDSIVAFKPPYLLAGRIRNATFGAVKANSFLEVGITAGTAFEDAANARVDSTVLVLDYNEYYGDTTQNLTINVHKLQQGFREDVTYFTNSTLTYDPTVIGTATFKPRPRTVIKKVVTNTTVSQSIPVRIRMSNSFGNDLLAQSGKTPLSSQVEFLKYLPGLALTSTDNGQAVLGFIASDSTYFRVYYTAGGKRQQYNLFLTSNQFTQLTTDRSGSTLAGLQNPGDSIPATATNNTAYLQESVGIKTKITFPYLDKFEQALGNAAINRAELIIPVKNTADFPPSPYVYLFQTNKRNRIATYNGNIWGIPTDGLRVDSSNPSPPPVTGFYQEATKAYTINVTSYVQGILNNRRLANGTTMQNTGILISPGSTATTQTSSANALALQSLRQTLLSMDSGNRIKLRIYYSTIQ